MSIENTPEFPNLSCTELEFRVAPPIMGIYLDECRAYLREFRACKGFDLYEDEEHLSYGVHEKDGSFTAHHVKSIPEVAPQDMIMRAAIAASHDKVTYGERNAAKRREVEKIRDIFSGHAKDIIKNVGKNPKGETDMFMLEFMLQGAMKNYNAKNTLPQNVKQFEFEREQLRIANIKQKSGSRKIAKPDDYKPY